MIASQVWNDIKAQCIGVGRSFSGLAATVQLGHSQRTDCAAYALSLSLSAVKRSSGAAKKMLCDEYNG